MLRERNTGLTTGDLLVSAIEELLDVLDPGGPKPWQHTAPDEQWRPDAADQGTTVSMTEIHGGEAWHPRLPGPGR
jgi:hypothetical protein